MPGYEQMESLKMAVPGANFVSSKGLISAHSCCIHALMLPY